MGSERAYQLLDQMGDTQRYVNYPEQMQKISGWITGLSTEDWTETLYNTWLYTFHPLLEVRRRTDPRFMQSLAWQDKQMNTVLGSWAELKHDTILYAKQAYAEMGGGPPPPASRSSCVATSSRFRYSTPAWRRWRAMTRDGLEARGMLE